MLPTDQIVQQKWQKERGGERDGKKKSEHEEARETPNVIDKVNDAMAVSTKRREKESKKNNRGTDEFA